MKGEFHSKLYGQACSLELAPYATISAGKDHKWGPQHPLKTDREGKWHQTTKMTEMPATKHQQLSLGNFGGPFVGVKNWVKETDFAAKSPYPKNRLFMTGTDCQREP